MGNGVVCSIYLTKGSNLFINVFRHAGSALVVLTPFFPRAEFDQDGLVTYAAAVCSALLLIRLRMVLFELPDLGRRRLRLGLTLKFKWRQYALMDDLDHPGFGQSFCFPFIFQSS